MSLAPPHGFVWPDAMPQCSMCDRGANDPVHVTPRPGSPLQLGGSIFALVNGGRQNSAELPKSRGPVRAHAYTPNYPQVASQVLCVACGEGLAHSNHKPGLPAGAGVKVTPKQAAAVEPQRAFVGQLGQRLVFAAPAKTGFDEDALPREIASAWRQLADAAPQNLWISGRYVEADRPNRNAAYWSTEDLELGHPTVKNGPINWLHDERQIIGSIAATELVIPDREAAMATSVGNHIVALGALWPYLSDVKEKARMVAKASDEGKLWYSMECVSRQVSCLSCDKTLSYGEYMQQGSQCEHMRAGMPRRFEEPVFEGAAVILPPVRPGWANADARVVMPQAAALAERQAAAFTGMSTSEAEELVAQLILSTTDPDANAS